MLASFLKSVGDEYKIEFRTDIKTQSLLVMVTRDSISRTEAIPFSFLADEWYIVRAIRNIVDCVKLDWRRARND